MNRRLLFLLVLFACDPSRAGTLPGPAFAPDRYRALWDDSPFAVATPVAVESQDYSLKGVAQFDGVSYVSIVNKQNQDHFVVTNSTPAHGLTLLSLVRGQNSDPTYATFQKGDAVLKLTLDTTAPLVPPTAPSAATVMANANPAGILTPGYSSLHRRPPHVRTFVPPVYVPIPPSSP